MSRVLVIGAGGQVGGALVSRLGGRGVGCWRRPPAGGLALDLARPAEAAAVVATARADVVCIAAGFTHVDGCEDDPDRADRVNRAGPAAVAGAARAAGARTVYLSTEYVFDGRNGPYDEEGAPNPRSVYGRSKLAGEEAVRAADPEALVVRTTVVWGPEEGEKNTAYQLIYRLGAGEPMRVPSDQVTTPTYNDDLAAAVIALLDAGVSGVVNVVGPELIDRATFARRLAAALGYDPDLVEPVVTAELGQRAERPLRAGLRVDRLRSLLPGVRLRTVEEAARAFSTQ